jgi:hypothetical protein
MNWIDFFDQSFLILGWKTTASAKKKSFLVRIRKRIWRVYTPGWMRIRERLVLLPTKMRWRMMMIPTRDIAELGLITVGPMGLLRRPAGIEGMNRLRWTTVPSGER